MVRRVTGLILSRPRLLILQLPGRYYGKNEAKG